MSGHLQLGRFGEDAAAQWYADSGYVVVDRNWSCPQGELDLVVTAPGDPSGGVVIFVEVKTRSCHRYGTGFDAVTADKQRRIRRLAAAWLTERRSVIPAGAELIRFDVVDVDSRGHVQIMVDAF